MPVVGDAIARPLLDEIEAGDYDLSGLFTFTNGGAPLSPTVRDRLLTALPHIMLLDAVGASESGAQMSTATTAGAEAQAATFTPQSDTAVVSADLDRVLQPGRGPGLAGPPRPDPARLPGRRGQDRQDLPDHRRRALVGAG